MKESALTMKEAASSVALAHHNILVNDVKMIDVNFIHAKIMGLVLSILLTALKQQLVTVR